MLKTYLTPDIEILLVDGLLLTVIDSGEQGDGVIYQGEIDFDWDVYT